MNNQNTVDTAQAATTNSAAAMAATTARTTISAAATETNGRTYRAICFDLDGTLLPMDIDEFLHAYFSRIVTFAGKCGLDAQLFAQALKQGIHAMAHHDDNALNSEAFWSTFEQIYCEGMPEDQTEETTKRAHEIADDFYENEFGHIGDGFVPNPASARIVAALTEKGYPLALTTMPMFPRRAVEHRLSWAGVDPKAFERITTYTNSRSTKPHHAYFAENLEALGIQGEDVLMVGNNTVEDLRFMDLGADAFLVTDCLLDPIDYDLSTVKHGSMEDLERWVATLPPCASPATDITDEAVTISK